MSVALRNRLPMIIAELPARAHAAVKVGAGMIAEDAKQRVHVGTHDPHLRDAIHTEDVGPGQVAVVAGNDDVFWGHLLEHGTTHSPPFPFLVPAFEAKRHDIQKLVIAQMRHL
jgi:HK97 gp10 family phage protein